MDWTFFPSLKKERIRKRFCKTLDLVGADLCDYFDYIENFYNRTRHHSNLGRNHPEAFETAAG